MGFELVLTNRACKELKSLSSNPALKKPAKAVKKALAYLQCNPRHPGLNTHKYTSLQGPAGEEIFEAYAENHTPGARRIFWFYGAGEKRITVIAITKHP